MASTHVQRAGCHCGAVEFEVEVPDRASVFECNCSMCGPAGYIHLIVPAASFRLLRGEEELTDYRFNTGAARHRFCRVCGIKAFYTPRSHPTGVSVNFRVLDAARFDSIEHGAFDGRNWEEHVHELDSAGD